MPKEKRRIVKYHTPHSLNEVHVLFKNYEHQNPNSLAGLIGLSDRRLAEKKKEMRREKTERKTKD